MTQAMNAKDISEAASDKEALQITILGFQCNDKTSKIGEELLDKKVGNNWKIVLVDDKVYGTNWSLVEKGTKISGYGILEDDWLINYDTGEIINLEGIKYTKMASTDNLGVPDHIIFNLDSSVIDGNVPNNKEELEKSLGEGVELKGFDYNENSGLTNTSFKFDGIDDYIEMKFDKDKYKFDGGLTLEFYGKLKGTGLLIDEVTNEIVENGGVSLGGFFEIRNSNVNKGKIGAAFGFDDDNGCMKRIVCNLGAGLDNDFSHPCIRLE